NFPAIKDILIDGMERRIQRPKNPKTQRRCYSGKKKAHTRENTVIASFERKILLLSPTKNGKLHDKKQLDKEGTMKNIPQSVTSWMDKGFQGIQKTLTNGNAVMMPKKKPRGRDLTEEQKAENAVISGIRMRVEHTIGGIKRYGCMSQVYRNKNGIDDKFTLVCAGLWNFHLKCA
ncbi:MAG: transposase family protein, partial [bacterium]